MSVALKDLANSTFAKLALAAAVSFGVAANANAQSLEANKCYPMETIKATLKLEGQAPIIIGNRLTDDRNSNVFTLNKKDMAIILKQIQLMPKQPRMVASLLPIKMPN